MNINLLDALSNLLNCEIVALHDFLNHPKAIIKVHQYLKDKKLRTTYYDRNLQRKEIKFGTIGLKSAAQQYAYEGFLGITVQMHYYCRHRIRLMWPRLKCLVEFGKTGHNRFYPLELVEVIIDDKPSVDVIGGKNGWLTDDDETKPLIKFEGSQRKSSDSIDMLNKPLPYTWYNLTPNHCLI